MVIHRNFHHKNPDFQTFYSNRKIFMLLILFSLQIFHVLNQFLIFKYYYFFIFHHHFNIHYFIFNLIINLFFKYIILQNQIQNHFKYHKLSITCYLFL